MAMGIKTQKQLKRERLLKIYFHYWKLQNNPEYIEFWKKQTAFLEDFQKNPKKHLPRLIILFLLIQLTFQTNLGLEHFCLILFKRLTGRAS